MNAHMRAMAAIAPSILGLAMTAACDGTGRDEGDETGGDGDTDADGGGDAGADTDTSTGTSDEGCTEGSKKIYVIGHNATLYSFWPPDQELVEIGKVQCPEAGSAYSMSVARDGTAYVLFYNGSTACQGLFKVSTDDASCLGKTAFTCGDQTFRLFGMGFATDGPSTTAETLYVGKTSAAYKLGKIDLSTFKVTSIGNISGAPEMTGNSKGELWAFFSWTSPPKVAQFDKATGAESNAVSLPQLTGNAAFAFAFWGGDFYLFHAPSGDTAVWKLSGGALTKYMPSTGVEIVGAGVSTCAPAGPI